jgi:glutaredoxin-like protein NrdH
VAMQHVPGENRGQIMLYALSTCGWCRKTREFLEKKKVDYRFVYVDLLSVDEKRETLKEMERWNPLRSFPTIVVDNQRVIVGYKPEEIEEAIGDE